MFRVLGYILIFLMMVCAVMTMGSFLRNVAPGWHADIIASILLFIIIDRLYTYRHLRTLSPLSREWAVAFGAQWVLIALLIRFLLSYASGIESFRADLSLFARGYILELFTAQYIGSLIMAFLVWFLTGRFLELLDEIGLDQKLALQEGPPPIQSDIVPAHQRLVGLIFSIGIALVILTALARLNLHPIVSNVEGIPSLEFSRFSGAEVGALLYFVFGLGLLSLSRLMSLQTHWNLLRIPVSSNNLTRQWGLYSLFFFLLLAVIVSLLPAGDSLGLFSLLATLLNFVVQVLFFIGQLLVSLILLLFSLPFFLLGRAAPVDNPSLAPPPLPTLPAQPVMVEPSATWLLLRSILLWGALALIVVFALLQFVRQHGGILPALRQSRITNWLVLAWQWLYRSAERTRQTVSRTIAEGWQNIVSRLEARRSPTRPNLIHLRSLDPRRQVYFFYHALIRRGGEQGIARKPSQTPAEYAAALQRDLPSATEDISAMTDAFVQARYSRQEIDRGRATMVKETWMRIRRALQSKWQREHSRKKS